MRIAALLALLLFSLMSYGQDVDIPDANFLAALISANVDLNGDGTIQASEAAAVEELNISNEGITNLTGIAAFTEMTKLKCNRNELTEVDLTMNPKIGILDISHNQLSEIDLSQNTDLYLLYIFNNNLTELDLSGLGINQVECNDNQLTSLDLSGNPNLFVVQCYNNDLTELDLSDNSNISRILCRNNELTHLDLNHLDRLATLSCDNNTLSALDISSNLNLEEVSADENMLTGQFDCSSNSSLLDLSVKNNEISDILFPTTHFLASVACSFNQIKNLDLSTLSELRLLEASHNLLEEIVFPEESFLDIVDLSFNQLESFDVPPTSFMSTLNIQQNSISALDLSAVDDIAFVIAGPLDYLNLTKVKVDFLDVSTDNFLIVCEDTDEVQLLQNSPWYLQNEESVTIIEECLFPLDFIFEGSRLEGEIRYDVSGTCDENSNLIDGILQLDFQLDSAAYTVSSFDQGGIIDIPAPSGAYSIVPVLPNSSAFTVDPALVHLDVSPLEIITQDFCISPNGSPHTDVVVKIIPVDIPRPGFESIYRIYYRNLGNVPASGELKFRYDETLVTFVSSNPIAEENPGQLDLLFTDLQPLEERLWTVVLRLNSPMDMPPLNDGDILEFKVQPIVQGINRTVPFCLEETLVNSFDPNDKRCLQGEFLLDSLLGQSLDYMIRFENTGTADAINIVIRDVIDTTVFDITSLQLVDSSNPVDLFIQDNEAVFSFAEINLPFAIGENEGYVVFEIETRSDLEPGDIISNAAEIFFDFNFPIVTETYDVEVVTDADGDGYHNAEDCDDNNPDINPEANEVAGSGIDSNCDGLLTTSTSDLEEELPFNLYPIPAESVLYFSSETLTNYQLSLYDLQGRMLLQQNDGSTIDVSVITTGTYMLRVVDLTNMKPYQVMVMIR